MCLSKEKLKNLANEFSKALEDNVFATVSNPDELKKEINEPDNWRQYIKYINLPKKLIISLNSKDIIAIFVDNDEEDHKLKYDKLIKIFTPKQLKKILSPQVLIDILDPTDFKKVFDIKKIYPRMGEFRLTLEDLCKVYDIEDFEKIPNIEMQQVYVIKCNNNVVINLENKKRDAENNEDIQENEECRLNIDIEKVKNRIRNLRGAPNVDNAVQPLYNDLSQLNRRIGKVRNFRMYWNTAKGLMGAIVDDVNFMISNGLSPDDYRSLMQVTSETIRQIFVPDANNEGINVIFRAAQQLGERFGRVSDFIRGLELGGQENNASLPSQANNTRSYAEIMAEIGEAPRQEQVPVERLGNLVDSASSNIQENNEDGLSTPQENNKNKKTN